VIEAEVKTTEIIIISFDSEIEEHDVVSYAYWL